jgi:anti-sigma regulatory factor (Ser/Thr protein kinase)
VLPTACNVNSTTGKAQNFEEPSATVTLRVPALLEYRDLGSRAVSTVCKHALSKTHNGAETDGSSVFINELMSAVGEAFNNIVVHAYDKSHRGMIEMELAWSRDGVTVKLRDYGRPFDFDAAPELDLKQAHESGMGIHIIRSFVDQATYRAGPPNVLELLKHLAQDVSRP